MLIGKRTDLSDVLQIVFDEICLAAKNPSHPFRFMSLSTVCQQIPEIRYVVLRAMDENGHLFFFTDYRTEKVEQIQANPEVSLLFYHPDRRVQVRMQGTASIHCNNDLAEKHWGTLEEEAKKAYNPVIKAGTPISQPEEAHIWPEKPSSDYFAVVKVVASQLDVLQLDGMSHIRAKFLRNEGQWTSNWIAP
jgi:pyridoxamine 5'-phosphate oxidase